MRVKLFSRVPVAVAQRERKSEKHKTWERGNKTTGMGGLNLQQAHAIDMQSAEHNCDKGFGIEYQHALD